MDEGMQTDRSDEQWENAKSPNTEIWQPVSNVKLERSPQPRKQDSPSVSTDAEIEID
jgi:hypothetical protein